MGGFGQEALVGAGGVVALLALGAWVAGVGPWRRRGAPPPPPRSDLSRRRPVWQALSELYLDTELLEADRERIAAVLRASGYTPEQLEAILALELHPVLVWNLFQVAGEWAAFDMAEVERRILGRRSRRSARWALVPGKRMVWREWEVLRARLGEPGSGGGGGAPTPLSGAGGDPPGR